LSCGKIKGIGVGNADATATAAVIQWVLRDFAGSIGRILFAWLQGTELDNNAKTWRLMADILNDLAMLLELLAPLFPHLFLLLLCIGSIARAIVGVAGGATRASITVHQARMNNMADVSAKDGSQETAVALTGMLLGVLATPLLEDNKVLVWVLFIVFTFFHLYANYCAVSAVVMDNLNRQRLSIVFRAYNSTGEVLTPEQVNKKERVMWYDWKRPPIYLGERLSTFVSGVSSDELFSVFEAMHGKEYFVLFLTKKKKLLPIHKDTTWESLLESHIRISVVLMKDCEFRSVVLSYFVAMAMKMEVRRKQRQKIHTAGHITVKRSPYEAIAEWESKFDDFVDKLDAAGWFTNKAAIGEGSYRATWRFVDQ